MIVVDDISVLSMFSVVTDSLVGDDMSIPRKSFVVSPLVVTLVSEAGEATSGEADNILDVKISLDIVELDTSAGSWVLYETVVCSDDVVAMVCNDACVKTSVVTLFSVTYSFDEFACSEVPIGEYSSEYVLARKMLLVDASSSMPSVERVTAIDVAPVLTMLSAEGELGETVDSIVAGNVLVLVFPVGSPVDSEVVIS